MKSNKTHSTSVDHLPLLTTIERKGQPYYDEPVYVTSRPRAVVNAVLRALERRTPPPLNRLVEYKHHKLKWVKPGDKEKANVTRK